MSEQPQIEWEDFARFVRQVSHDLRNQLNAAELQAALVSELSEDAALKPEVAQLRKLVAQMGTSLQHLSGLVALPRPTKMPYPAGDFIEDFRQKLAQTYGARAEAIEWQITFAGEEAIEIDPTLLQAALLELFENAFRFGAGRSKLKAKAELQNGEFVITLREENANLPDDEATLHQPLRNVSHGHYGLGRRNVGTIVAENGGRFDSGVEGDTLWHRIVLPCSPR